MVILKKALKRDWHLKCLSLTLLVLFGISLTWVCFQKNMILTIMGLAFSVIGLKLLAQNLRQSQIEHSPLVYLLLNEPEQIVWVYSVMTQRMPFGLEWSKNGIMYFKLLDGDEITVTLAAGDLRLVSKFLNRLLPHASFGYSKEKEKMYEINPEHLLKR